MIRKKDNFAALLFLTPNVLGFLLLTLGPIVASLYFSFTEWNTFTKPVWVGLNNFNTLFHDFRFAKTIVNTLYYTVVSVPLGIIIALFFAILLNSKIRGVIFFRTLYFLPVISSTVAVALLWRWLYSNEFGLFAYLLSLVGVQAPPFLTSTAWAMPSIIVMSIWKGLGYNIVLILAGLQAISPTYYEAALIDGVSNWQRFWFITRPLLSPTLFFVTIMAVMGSFQVFEQTYMLTKGGPAFSTTTIVYYIYIQGFQTMKMGLASAAAWVLFMGVMIVTLVQWRFQERWVHYQ